MRTQVAIVGAGPAGLMLAHLLHRADVSSVVLEARDRDYVEHRVRAGVLEHDSVELLVDKGLGERLRREGIVHHGLELRFGHQGHRIALSDLTGGRTITIYGQQEVVRDLIAARLQAGQKLLFDVENVTLHDLTEDEPRVRFRHNGEDEEIRCEIVAGCDGFHGVSRPSIPDSVRTEHNYEYPFGWLGVLADVPPSTEELIYTNHENGFALHSLRSPKLSRLYLQCEPDDKVERWSDEDIWRELRTRFETNDGWTLNEGPIVEKGITPMRSFVVDPMQYGNLYLAGDAAHIVPPTGAKGLNLALRDIRVLAEAIIARFRDGHTAGLEAYSETCLQRVWRTQHFSWWMTMMLHRQAGASDFQRHLQMSQLEYVCRSRAAATTLAENYVGLAQL